MVEWSCIALESLPFGGRKTTGYAQTEPLQVLYNGMREFTVLSVTHLYDWANANEDGVVQHPCSKTQLFRSAQEAKYFRISFATFARRLTCRQDLNHQQLECKHLISNFEFHQLIFWCLLLRSMLARLFQRENLHKFPSTIIFRDFHPFRIELKCFLDLSAISRCVF